MSENDELIDSVIEKIKNNIFDVYFYCPPINVPSGGMSTLFRLAKHLKDSDYNVKLIYEPRLDQRASYEKSVKANKQMYIYEKFDPQWLEFSISNIDIIPLGDKTITFTDGTSTLAQSLKLNPEDLFIIPEGFPDIMKKTQNVACKRIVLAQSWFYVLNAMGAGERWQNFGINDVISISSAITDYLNSIMPGLKIKNLSQGINRDLFKKPEKLSDKAPMIGFLATRGQENLLKTYNIIKMFQSIYPQYKWVRFIDLASNTREEFAEKLKSCSFFLYTDDIAGFGTSPLEAMACGTHVIGWASFGGKEYMAQDNGFWTNNGDIFQTAEIIGIALDKYLLGELDADQIKNSYEKTLEKYTIEGENTRFLEIINEYKNERTNELKSIKKQ